MARREILTQEHSDALMEAFDQACTRRDVEGRNEETVAAIEEARRAFEDAQIEALRDWPYTYDGGEVPMRGDEIQPLDDGPDLHAFVLELHPPMVKVGGHVDVLRKFAERIGATVAPCMFEMIPQCCRLVRRHEVVPDS